jgi:hypothetical protein
MSETTERQFFSMRDLKCDNVVVYTDRAEVRRLIQAVMLIRGENEMVIKSITDSIDRDSVRVEGHGDGALVLDVVCERKIVETSKSETSEKVKQLREEMDTLESTLELSQQKLARNQKQLEVLNEFASSLSKPSGANGKVNEQKLINNKENIQNFISFMQVYSSRLETLDKEKIAVNAEIKKAREQAEIAKANLEKLTSSSGFNFTK